MVTVILRGGLGNQMFQYAAGLNLALNNKTKLVLDTTYLHDRWPRRDFTHRDYDLDIFELSGPDAITPFTTLSKISGALPIPGLWIRLDLFLMKFHQRPGMRKNQILWGYFQSEKYFAERKDAVRGAFRFREVFNDVAAAIAEKLARENSVAIHVRRGDYLTAKAQAVHGLLGVDYYQRAVAYIAERVAAPHFFVFSDDVAWCRENLPAIFPAVGAAGTGVVVTYVDDASRGPKASFHLQLMSLCKHNIIANSSFSWWGAWLNRNSGKIVVAPEQWSNAESSRGRLPGEGIIPDSWVAL